MKLRLADSLPMVKLRMVDTAVKAENRRLTMYKGQVSCKPGCSGCYSKIVNVTVAEALIIYEHLFQKGVWTGVKELCLEQVELLKKDITPLTWFKMNQKCPALDRDTDLCLTYQARPATCSCHFVTSDPGLCGPWTAGSGEFQSLDFEDLFEDFAKRLKEIVREQSLFSYIFPMPSALLLAELISVRSGMNLADAIAFHFKQL